jgi:site-specific DNA-cytosine methylase
MKDIKYATIVPLVGGMTIGNHMATGKWPEYFLSYEAFEGNDSNITNYLNNDKKQDIPYYQLDSEEFSDEDLKAIQTSEIDFVSAVCPCAGLSMLNASNRGSDAEANQWMYKSARFVLENVKPKVFWGENAPGLISSVGEGVRKELFDIAKEFGYSFSIVKTSSMEHGLPQRRVRTFYFFWKSEAAPIMNYYSRDMPTLEEFIKTIPEDATYQEPQMDLNENIFFKWFKENYERKDIKYSNYTVIKLIEKDRTNLESLKEYILENGNEREIKKINHIINKYSQGKGVCDDSPHFYTDVVNAIITKNMKTAVHPTEDRYLNNRELMLLMGLPNDFQLVSKNWSVYTQNVPTFTARDWTNEVVKFVNGELELSEGRYIVQDNLTQKNKIEVPAKELKTKAIF